MKEQRNQINPNIYVSIDLLGYLAVDGDWHGNKHSHIFWEMVISTYDFKKFYVELFEPNEYHSFTNEQKRTKHMLYIGFDFKQNYVTPIEKTKSSLLSLLRQESNNDIFSILFDKIINSKQCLQDSTYYIRVITFIINTIDKYMLSEGGKTRDTALVTETKKYINSNLKNKITVCDIAHSLYISPKHLGQVFKTETGTSILSYVNCKKMEKALLLLKSGEYNVTQVSEILGFDNICAFSAAFKKYYGLSPSHFLGANYD